MKLVAYSSSESGGMNGGRSLTSITYTGEGRCKVTTANKPFHNQPTRHENYYADGLLEKLSAVCERYNVISWTDLPDNEIILLDGATSSENFTFNNGITITLGSRKKYPPNAHEMFEELKELIEESLNYGTEMEVTIEEPMAPMSLMEFQMNMHAKKQDTGKQETETANLAKFCSNCGAKFTGDQKFCAECGAKRPTV